MIRKNCEYPLHHSDYPINRDRDRVVLPLATASKWCTRYVMVAQSAQELQSRWQMEQSTPDRMGVRYLAANDGEFDKG